MIRPAEERDLLEIMAIEASSFDSPWSEDGFRAFMNRPGIRFLVWEEDYVRGFIVYSFVSGEAEIYDIAVAPLRRRHGIGSALLGEALKESETVFLDVRRGNMPARRLYESRGFEQVGVRKAYYDNDEDAIVMKWSRKYVFDFGN